MSNDCGHPYVAPVSVEGREKPASRCEHCDEVLYPGPFSEWEVECNICGIVSAPDSVEFGSQKIGGESASIGMSICADCRAAVEWHEKQGHDRCASCGEETNRTVSLAGPGKRGWSAELDLCRDCHMKTGGMMHTFESDVKIRGRANVKSSWEEQRRSALQRDSYSCEDCGANDCRLHVHHKIPRSQGGSDHLENLISLCPDCHADRHNTGSCALCGGLTDQEMTWLDRSGGGIITVCDNCQSYIQRGSGSERCSICARFYEGGRSDGLYDHTAVSTERRQPETHNACDECRKTLLFGDWWERQKYIDNELPDSHANVRYWESDAE